MQYNDMKYYIMKWYYTINVLFNDILLLEYYLLSI